MRTRVLQAWSAPLAAARAAGRRRNVSTRSARRRCPASAPTLAKRLRALGLETVARSARCTRRAATSRAADEVAIAQLGGDEGGCDRRRRPDARSRRLRGRRTLVTARFATPPATIGAVVVQPAVARREAEAGHARAAARQARPLRLRRQVLRPRRGARDRRLRAGLPGERAVPSTRLRELVRAALPMHAPTPPIRCRPSSSCRCARDALAALHFPASEARGRGGPAAARARRALHAAARRRARSRDEDAVAPRWASRAS